MSNMQCYYWDENDHVQARCKQMKEDLKKLRDMNKDGKNSQAMVESTQRFEILLFDGKINFMI